MPALKVDWEVGEGVNFLVRMAQRRETIKLLKKKKKVHFL